MLKFFKKLTPDCYEKSISDINLEYLHSKEYNTLLIDLDNTILPWKSSDVPKESIDWIKKAKSMGFNICIVSNTHYPKRLKKISDKLGVEYIYNAMKPRKACFDRALKIFEDRDNNIKNNIKPVVVGDQLFTDIYGGNRCGIFTILVKPMDKTEFIGTRINRLFEAVVLRFIGDSLKGTKSFLNKSEKEDDK
ncbi:MAG: YqeG family HAD IIIA-type phosphatase [Armatimonadota bacterium]